MGTFLGVGNDPRYTPTTCLKMFQFPEPTEEQRTEIAEAVRRLDELRRDWLNPERASATELKKCTLTNLYNARMDAADLAAQGEPGALSDEELLKNLLARQLTNRLKGKEAAPHARRGHLPHHILRHEEVQGSYPGLERPGIVAVAMVHAALRALVKGGADVLGHPRLQDLLEHQLEDPLEEARVFQQDPLHQIFARSTRVFGRLIPFLLG